MLRLDGAGLLAPLILNRTLKFMQKLLQQLITKNFSVYVCGEFERKANFLELIRLWANYSDFLSYSTKEQTAMLKKWLKIGEIYIDADIYVKIF